MAPSCLEMGPSWLHVGSSWAQVGPKIGPGRVQEVSQCVPRGSWEGPGGSRSSKGSQGRSRDQFLIDFDRFLMILGPILGRVFDHFLVFLGVNF